MTCTSCSTFLTSILKHLSSIDYITFLQVCSSNFSGLVHTDLPVACCLLPVAWFLLLLYNSVFAHFTLNSFYVDRRFIGTWLKLIFLQKFNWDFLWSFFVNLSLLNPFKIEKFSIMNYISPLFFPRVMLKNMSRHRWSGDDSKETSIFSVCSARWVFP